MIVDLNLVFFNPSESNQCLVIFSLLFKTKFFSFMSISFFSPSRPLRVCRKSKEKQLLILCDDQSLGDLLFILRFLSVLCQCVCVCRCFCGVLFVDWRCSKSFFVRCSFFDPFSQCQPSWRTGNEGNSAKHTEKRKISFVIVRICSLFVCPFFKKLSPSIRQEEKSTRGTFIFFSSFSLSLSVFDTWMRMFQNVVQFVDVCLSGEKNFQATRSEKKPYTPTNRFLTVFFICVIRKKSKNETPNHNLKEQ